MTCAGASCVERSRIVAVLLERDEDEVVVDPRDVRLVGEDHAPEPFPGRLGAYRAERRRVIGQLVAAVWLGSRRTGRTETFVYATAPRERDEHGAPQARSRCG